MTNGIIIRNGVKYAGGSSSSSSDVKVVDVVEKGNKNAVTSNAVANAVESVSAGNVYSTGETLTGGTWIDGKPIYRKVLTAEVLASDNVVNARLLATFSIDAANISQVVSLKGSIKVKGTDRYVECGGTYYVNDKPQLSTNLSANNSEALCVLQNGPDGVSWLINKDLEVTAIVEYTKTTD